MIDKAALLKARFGEEAVEIPGVGEVRVRALTRGEALQVKGKEQDIAAIEQWVLSRAMVEPEMSEADVKAWQDASPAGELQVVFDAVLRLSGMEQTAAKAAYKSVRGG